MKINCLVDYKRLLNDKTYQQHISKFHSLTFTHWPAEPEQYLIMRRCYDWARSNGIEVRGKALFFTRGTALTKELAEQRWYKLAKRLEQITQDFDCCLWEVAAEAWTNSGESRRCGWSVDSAEVWIEKAFKLYSNCTSSPLYYADFGAYHPNKLKQTVLPALHKIKLRGTRIDGFSLQLASSLFPRIPLESIESITKKAHSLDFLVEWPENIAWDVVGRQDKITSQLLNFAVEKRQASIYKNYQKLAISLGVERSSVWFPWEGFSYHWKWDSKLKCRQPSNCGLWNTDWSTKPAFYELEPFLKR